MLLSRSRSQVSQKAAAVGPAGQFNEVSFPAFGHECRLQWVGDDPALGAAFREAVADRLKTFDRWVSPTGPESLIRRINEGAGKTWVEIDPEFELLLQLCDSLQFMTQGTLDSAQLPVTRLWAQALQGNSSVEAIPSSEHVARASAQEIAHARRLAGWVRVSRQPGQVYLPESGMGLDFSPWIRAYAVDVLIALARGHGLSSVSIGCGNNCRSVGLPPGKSFWTQTLAAPSAAPGHALSLQVMDQGVAWVLQDSAGRPLGDVFETTVIDPRSGVLPAHGCTQAVVVAPTCLQARALAIAAFVLGPAAGMQLLQSSFSVEGSLLQGTNRHQTRGFSKILGVEI